MQEATDGNAGHAYTPCRSAMSRWVALRSASQLGTGRFFERRNSGLNSFD